MHPILANRTRSLLYVAAWLPIAACLTQLLTGGGAMPYPWQAAVIVFPMCLLYAFICQASWYLCNAVPLRENALRLVTTHLTAAAVSAGSWVLIGWGWAWALQVAFEIDGLAFRYLDQIAALFISGV